MASPRSGPLPTVSSPRNGCAGGDSGIERLVAAAGAGCLQQVFAVRVGVDRPK